SSRRIEHTSGDGTRTVRYVVSGYDWHDRLNTSVYLNANLNQIAGGANPSLITSILLLGNRFSQFMSPGQIVEALFESVLGNALTTDANGKVEPLDFEGRVGQPLLVPPAVTARIAGSPVE